MTIHAIHARQILDSRGNPTVETDLILEDGSSGRAAVPSGASTGRHEALELRDGGSAFGGQGVRQAIEHVNHEISATLIGREADQAAIDRFLINLDGTPNKSRLGANAILSVSLALAKAVAAGQEQELFEYIGNLAGVDQPLLPLPMMNVTNGGAHANWTTDIQEYLLIPVGADSFSQAIQMGTETFHALGKILAEAGYLTTVGDEGGYAPRFQHGNGEPLELMARAVTAAGYQLGSDIAFAVDAAASEFYRDGRYRLARDNQELSGPEMINWLEKLAASQPIISIEDGLAEDDWDNWAALTQRLGNRLQLVGDDLFVTNTTFLRQGIELGAANAILIKLNQIGTLTETIEAVALARQHGYRSIVSHRSGETEDTTIAHLAVGLGTGQIKTGSLSRSERVAKYNELLRIEEYLGADAAWLGKDALARR